MHVSAAARAGASRTASRASARRGCVIGKSPEWARRIGLYGQSRRVGGGEQPGGTFFVRTVRLRPRGTGGCHSVASAPISSLPRPPGAGRVSLHGYPLLLPDGLFAPRAA